MAHAVPREVIFSYGGFALGKGTDRSIESISFSRSYERASVSVAFVTTATTEALFATEVAAVEAAFRVPNGAILITADDGSVGAPHTLLTISPADNTGFETDPSISISGATIDTARSRRYTATVNWIEPADLAGQSGRRESARVDLSYDASRIRTLTLSGTYTPIPGGGTISAKAQYDAAIGAYQAAIIAGIGGAATYNLLSERVDVNDNDTVCNYTRVLEEINANEKSGSLDDADLVQQTLSIGRNREGPGDSQLEEERPERLQQLTVSYSAAVDRTATTDLRAKWEGDIRPWLLEHVADVTQANGMALVSESPRFDSKGNRIEASLTLLARVGSSLIEATVTTDDEIDLGRLLTPVWDDVSPLAKFIFQGPGSQTRTITTRTRRALGGGTQASGDGTDGSGGSRRVGLGFGGQAGDLGQGFGGVGGGFFGFGSVATNGFTITNPSGGGGGGGGGGNNEVTPTAGTANGFVRLGERRSSTVTRLGLPGYQLDIVDETTVVRLARVVSPQRAASGGGGGTVERQGPSAAQIAAAGGG